MLRNVLLVLGNQVGPCSFGEWCRPVPCDAVAVYIVNGVEGSHMWLLVGLHLAPIIAAFNSLLL